MGNEELNVEANQMRNKMSRVQHVARTRMKEDFEDEELKKLYGSVFILAQNLQYYINTICQKTAEK